MFSSNYVSVCSCTCPWEVNIGGLVGGPQIIDICLSSVIHLALVVDEKNWCSELHEVCHMLSLCVLIWTLFCSALGVICCGYICLVLAVRYFIPLSHQRPPEMTCTRTIPQSVPLNTLSVGCCLTSSHLQGLQQTVA